KSTGLFATGTSCLALVCVIGRSRVPRPPERISPLSGPMGSVRPPELAMVPADRARRPEAKPHPLGRLSPDHLLHLGGQLPGGVRARVAPKERPAEFGHALLVVL